MTQPLDLGSPRSENEIATRGWSLRARLVVWNVVALALLLGALGVVVRCAVNSLLLISVDRRLETEVRTSPAPGHRAAPDENHDNSRGPGDDHGPEPGPDADNGPPGGQPPEQGDSPNRPPPNGSRGGPDGPPPQGDYQNGPGPGGPPGNGRPRQRRIRANQTLEASSDPVEPYAARHFDLNGNALGSRGLLDASGFIAVRNARSEDYFSHVMIRGVQWRVLTRPYREQGRLFAIVQAGYPLTEVNEALAGLDFALLMMIPVGLLFAGAGGAYLTSHVLRSVRHTATAAALISVNKRGDFSARLPVVGKDEFAELATTINQLLGRLEGAFQKQIALLDQQRRFTADASHELKTPLTVIRGNASMTLNREASTEDYRRSLQKIDRAAETMANLVQDLLLLAKADSDRLETDRIELLVPDLIHQALVSVRHDGAAIPVACPAETLTVVGNEGELVRVFVNLLTNAIRYAPPPASVSVSVTKADNYVRIRVIDTGSGIAPENLRHLGERFYRVDASRTRADGGSGLGLSICKSIIEAHGGKIAFESIIGHGTTVSVFLPLGS